MKNCKVHIYEFCPSTISTEIIEVSKSMFYYYCGKYCNNGYDWVKNIIETPEKIVSRLTIWTKS